MTRFQYQVTVQWIISAFTNDPEKLARFGGLLKGVVAGGLAASFGTEAAGLAQLNVVAYNFTLQAVGLVCMAFVCWRCVTATNYRLEDNDIPIMQAVPGEQGMTESQNLEPSTIK